MKYILLVISLLLILGGVGSCATISKNGMNEIFFAMISLSGVMLLGIVAIVDSFAASLARMEKKIDEVNYYLSSVMVNTKTLEVVERKLDEGNFFLNHIWKK